jgi:hypothetical protein
MDLDLTCPRYSRAALPPYAYLPGRAPHPRSDPRGHSYGHAEARAERLDPAAWASSETWRRAVDLHNFGYFWEAHEALEILWRGAGGGGARPGLLADFFQGLIQVCAAHVKHALGVQSAVDALLTRALPRLAGAPSPFLGMDLRAFERDSAAYLRGERGAPPRITLALDPT